MTSLNKICIAIVDCEHKTAPSSPGGKYPSIRTSNIQNGRIDFDGAERVDEGVYRDWTRRRAPEPGDIILTREAPVGEAGLVPPGRVPCLGQRTVLLSPDRSRVEPRFLLYLLLTPGVQHEMKRKGAGSTVAHLNMSDIRGLPIPDLPGLTEQRAVADALGALDDKIELNREMNCTLEATAQAIFRSWFVDFDPVVAKADGRKPFGMSDEIAALFPDRFTGSELGPIPEGWQISTIGQEVDAVGGSTPSTKEPKFWGGEIHWATPKDLSGQAHAALFETARTITEEGLAKISSGLLPRGTVLMSSRAPVGYLAITEVETAVNQGFIAMRCNGRVKEH